MYIVYGKTHICIGDDKSVIIRGWEMILVKY